MISSALRRLYDDYKGKVHLPDNGFVAACRECGLRQATPTRATDLKRFVGADKPDKRHVVFNDRSRCAPATNSTAILPCSITLLISIRTPRNGKRRMKSKSQKIRDALAAGDRLAALRFAAHFHDRSANTLTYKRGFDAHNHPAFYRQLGHEPEQLTAAAIALLENSFNRSETR